MILHSMPLRLTAGLAAALVVLVIGPRSLAGAAPAVAAVRAQPADSPATRLTVADVKARLAAATQSAPPDFSKGDLSGLDLTGLDF